MILFIILKDMRREILLPKSGFGDKYGLFMVKLRTANQEYGEKVVPKPWWPYAGNDDKIVCAHTLGYFLRVVSFKIAKKVRDGLAEIFFE